MSVVVFRLGQAEFGISLDQVRRIEAMIPITRIPQSPPYLHGLASVKGEIVPIVNLKRLFGLGDGVYGEGARMLIVAAGTETVGIPADAVTGIERLPADAIEPPPALAPDISGVYLTGVVRRVAEGSEQPHLLLLLDLRSVLAVPETPLPAQAKGEVTGGR
jgi:purine-binding chemotaxis protein CheW